MPMYSPETEYAIINKTIPIKDFHEYKEEFVIRPPYQRKNVWSKKKQQGLLDSLFRRYYVPRIVLREVKLASDKKIQEVVDGQQRIDTVQKFLSDKLPLPNSLGDVLSTLPGSTYSSLYSDIRRFVDRDIIFSADVIQRIDDPQNTDHQKIATEIFWRLQQGETLNYMEIAHSRLSSLSRNFIVKYSDDQRFDYGQYIPIDSNPDKHIFFQIISRDNGRMQHLALLTRLLILEENNGPSDISNEDVMAFIDRYKQADGIGNYSFENERLAKNVLGHLQSFYEVFRNDPMVLSGGTIKELSVEYFIISIYLLQRHLKEHYVFQDAEKSLFRNFVTYFYQRWRGSQRANDFDIILFSENRQHSAGETHKRDMILRQLFFEFAFKQSHEIITKDTQRAFSETERIRIYRRDSGLCQECLKEGKPENECLVPWSQYDADHVIPHSKGGATTLENAQVLCQYHNRSKGDST